MDPKTATLLSMEAVEAWADPLQGTDSEGNRQATRRANGGKRAWPMATEHQPYFDKCAAEYFLQLPRPPKACPMSALLPNRRVRARTHGGVTGKTRES